MRQSPCPTELPGIIETDLRIREGQLDVFQDAALGAIDFLLRRRIGGEAFDSL